MRKILITLAHYLLFTKSQESTEPVFKIMENHTMESPITHKEFDNWETYGSSLFQKGRIIVVPEVADTRGAIVSKKFTNHRDSWIADIKVRIGNDN